MTELSPAAQAVAWAYDNAPERPTGNHRYHWIAAALRAIDEELASCLFVGPDEGDIKRVIDVSDLHDLIDELEAQ
jgi:hypothetical protein